MIDFDTVEKIINSEIDEGIRRARDLNRKLRLHIDGIGLNAALCRINNYENEKQFEAREKHAISNQFITEELLRPTDNAFSAKGGSRNYKFNISQEANEVDFLEKLTDVKEGMSLSEYIEKEWFHKLLTDPNGLIVVEIKSFMQKDDPEPELKPVPSYKSIHSIRKYKQNGQKVDWVIFEPHKVHIDKENKNKKTEIFWAIDEEAYYLYQRRAKELLLIEMIENSFGYVPAILCSNIYDPNTGMKASPIQKQVELLDKYMLQNSVLTIAEFFHNYPREWTYIDECANCNGQGKIIQGNNESEGILDYNRGHGDVYNSGYRTCETCQGTGKAERKDVTDVIKLKVPDKDGVKIDPPSGYTYMPTEPWELMAKSVDRTWNLIYYSQWGTTVEKGKNETATGRFIDVQPVNNKLEMYSRMIERSHSLLATMIGQFYFPLSFEKAYVKYGRRYLVETPDQLWEKYLKAKESNAPVVTLDMLLYQFFESEYRENEMLYMYEVKKAKLEPFVHWRIELVRASETINDFDKAKKEYFNEWCQRKTQKDIIDTELRDLEKDLDDFIKSKTNILPLILSQNESETNAA